MRQGAVVGVRAVRMRAVRVRDVMHVVLDLRVLDLWVRDVRMLHVLHMRGGKWCRMWMVRENRMLWMLRRTMRRWAMWGRGMPVVMHLWMSLLYRGLRQRH